MKNQDFDESENIEKEYTLVDAEEAGGYISEGGALSKISPNFEERTVQIDLLKNIVKVFNQNKLGVFEAGTGVGKSYAYLIPSVLWALTNDEKVVISTGTINLQQQLCEKDIPAVEKILGKKVNYILMKGRQNFICRRRLAEASLPSLELFEDEAKALKEIAEWAETSPTGSKSDLPKMPPEALWSRLNSESDACMGKRCPYMAECFVMKLRKEALNSSIIVVNHHLLFADIESRLDSGNYADTAVLPPYRHVVFDEAHGIEAAATSFFSQSLTRFNLNRLIGQMYRKRKNSETGHLCTLAIMSSNEEKAEGAEELVAKIKAALSNLEVAGKDLLFNDYTKRLYPGTARDAGPFLVSVNQLADCLGLFNDLIRVIMSGINDDDKDFQSYWESKNILRHLDDYVMLLKSFTVWDEKPEYVFWIQKKKLSGDFSDPAESEYIVLNRTPLDISRMMNAGVFEPMSSVVCTSATLKTGRDFNYWMSRTGLNFAERERLLLADYESPFPYEKNMLLAVPSDAPFSDTMDFQPYIETAIPRLIKASEGRTLVLFTSYESLRSAWTSCKALLKGFSGQILRQGEADNSKLLEQFRSEKESVLFATDSFWQGVDIPGEALSQVIIVKLPFTVPNDPVFKARSEAVEKKGGSSFMELSVPEAVIKFRQGIGRLIRKSDDKGVVTVLDRRIFEKRYGSVFVMSIPECKKIYEPLKDLLNKINSFIFN